MRNTILLWPEVILGAEDDDPQEAPQGSGPGDSPDDPEEPEEDPEDDSDDPEDVASLRNALARERDLRKQREKEASEHRKKVQRFEQQQRDAELADQTELQQAQTKLQEAQQANEILLTNIKKDRVNRAIEMAAEKFKFIDMDDALSQVNRSDIEITEDEDNLFLVSQASVEAAVKALATKKPHLVRVGTDDGDPSGSSFGSKGRKKSGPTDEELAEKYPALGR